MSQTAVQWGSQAVHPVKSVQSFTTDLKMICSNLFCVCKLVLRNYILDWKFCLNLNMSKHSEHLYCRQRSAACLYSNLYCIAIYWILWKVFLVLQINQSNTHFEVSPLCTCGIMAIDDVAHWAKTWLNKGSTCITSSSSASSSSVSFVLCVLVFVNIFFFFLLGLYFIFLLTPAFEADFLSSHMNYPTAPPWFFFCWT